MAPQYCRQLGLLVRAKHSINGEMLSGFVSLTLPHQPNAHSQAGRHKHDPPRTTEPAPQQATAQRRGEGGWRHSPAPHPPVSFTETYLEFIAYPEAKIV